MAAGGGCDAVGKGFTLVGNDLTTQQKSRFRKAYRDTFEAENHGDAIKSLYAKYSELYGVNSDVLRALVAEDLKKNPKEYAKLRQGLLKRRASTTPAKNPPERPGLTSATPAGRNDAPARRKKTSASRKKAESKAKKPRKSRLAVCTRNHAPWEYCSACEGHNRNVKESNHSVRFENKRGATRVIGGGLPGLGRGR